MAVSENFLPTKNVSSVPPPKKNPITTAQKKTHNGDRSP